MAGGVHVPGVYIHVIQRETKRAVRVLRVRERGGLSRRMPIFLFVISRFHCIRGRYRTEDTVDVGEGCIGVAVKVEKELLDAGIMEFGVRAGAEFESLREGAVDGNVFEAKVVVIGAVGGEEDEGSRIRAL